MSSKAAVEFPRGVQDRTTIAVYIFGIAIRGQKYNSEFRFGRWKFCKRPRRSFRTEEVSSFEATGSNFFDLSHRKSGSDRGSGSGILVVQYVACDPDNVVDANANNRHTNYCLAWALSDS